MCAKQPAWTEEELAYLAENYGKIHNPEIYAHLPRHSPDVIKIKANSFGLKDVRYWTEEELTYLAENYGKIPRPQIMEHLGRSENALKIAAYRKRGKLSQKTNIITCRDVAGLLGVACSKTVSSWVKRGFLPGTRAPLAFGKYQVWNFEWDDIEAFLRKYPWMVDCRKVGSEYLRDIIKKEYARDPWYTAIDAAPFFGLVDRNAVHRFIYRGWLKAVRRPHIPDGISKGHPWQGQWIIRKSAIDAMLANDPRPMHAQLALRKSRKRIALQKGWPVAIVREWLMKCPGCGRRVHIKADPHLSGRKVRDLFVKTYATGTCSHKRTCVVKREPKLRIRRAKR